MGNKNNREEPVYRPKRIRVGFTVVNPTGKPVPVAKASSQIQLTPIVQPVSMVPLGDGRAPAETDEDDDF